MFKPSFIISFPVEVNGGKVYVTEAGHDEEGYPCVQWAGPGFGGQTRLSTKAEDIGRRLDTYTCRDMTAAIQREFAENPPFANEDTRLLDSGTIALNVTGEKVCFFGQDLRAAIKEAQALRNKRDMEWDL